MKNVLIVISICAAVVGTLPPRVTAANYTAVVLAPPQMSTGAEAFGAAVGNQVGFFTDSAGTRAALWNGPGSSAISLHPANYLYSIAFATSTDTQVGAAIPPSNGGLPHAAM